MKKGCVRNSALVAILMLLSAVPAAAQTYTFGGFTWNQNDTPDRTTLLAPGVYGDVTMTLAPTTATGSPDFPVLPDLVFIDTLAPGAQLEPPIDDPYGPRAINLPSGNNGTTQRSGFEMTWTNSRVLTNDAGDDLVVYESGSTNAPEAFILRVHQSGGSWTDWWYEADDGFQVYPSSADGAFATGIDLTDLGIASGASIDAIQIANLRNTDQLATGSDPKAGFVDPAGDVTPQNSLSATYGATSLDPDPIYVAALHEVAGVRDTESSFAGFTWDQNDSPESGAVLANGTYGDAVITNQPNAHSDQTDFPDLLAGYDSNRSPGQFLAFDTDGTVAINMPQGNDGTANRSGLSVEWSGDVGIRNLAGDDFIVFESGTSGTPEGFMVRVYDADAAAYSRWYHEPYDAFAAYGGAGSDGAFATAYDLTALGVPAGHRVTEIQIANLRSTDLIDSGTSTGFVFPAGTGADGGDTAQPYAGTALDPDILYVASLQAAVGPNTAPTVDVSLVSPSVDEGSAATLNGTLTDAEGGDLEVTIDWGDGSAAEIFTVPDGTNDFSRQHTYLDDNPTATSSDNYTIDVTVEDSDGASSGDSTVIAVDNVNPLLSGLSIVRGPAGGTTTLNGTISDAGSQDTFTLQVNWGDGDVENFNYGAGTTAFSETHVYDADGTYTVSLLLTDDDTGTASSALTAQIGAIPADIPTASTWMLMLMGALLAVAGLVAIRR